MIAALLAAVIAQPLDAEFRTADAPRNFGVNLAMRYPSTWAVLPGDEPHGIANLATRDGSIRVALWAMPDAFEWAARNRGGDQTLQAYYLGPLKELVAKLMPEGANVSEGWYTTIGGRPAQAQEFRAIDGSFAGSVVGFLDNRTVVLLWFNVQGADAVSRYEAAKPMFAAIGESVSEGSPKRASYVIPATVAGLVLVAIAAAFVAHRRSTSSKGSELSSRPRALRPQRR